MGFRGAALSLEVGGAMFSLASPLLVIIFKMAMVMPSGGATYVFSGKDAGIPFFLVKAQSRAHATPSPHSRAVAGSLQGSPVNYSEFFARNGVKPDDLSAAQWTDMSATAYHIIVSMLGDAKMQ